MEMALGLAWSDGLGGGRGALWRRTRRDVGVFRSTVGGRRVLRSASSSRAARRREFRTAASTASPAHWWRRRPTRGADCGDAARRPAPCVEDGCTSMAGAAACAIQRYGKEDLEMRCPNDLLHEYKALLILGNIIFNLKFALFPLLSRFCPYPHVLPPAAGRRAMNTAASCTPLRAWACFSSSSPSRGRPPGPCASSSALFVTDAEKLLSSHLPATTTEPQLVAVLCAYASASLPEKALAAFRSAVPSLPAPITPLPFNALLSTFLRCRKHNRVPQLFPELSKEFSITPNATSYAILVKAYCMIRDDAKALQVLDQMREQGISPTTSIYTSLIDSDDEAPELEASAGASTAVFIQVVLFPLRQRQTHICP
ncbi:hypothetical protein EJB05_37098, partial [Eragrostis curvula]